MIDSRRKLLPLLISALASTTAGAVGLGDIELHSYLGKPLNAMIPLNHLGDLGADQLRVSLGNEEEYQALGVEFSYQHTLMRLEPVIQNGRGYVRVITREPIAEPYLNFVLNLRWPQGQVVREYAVLLDPPAMNNEVVAAARNVHPINVQPIGVQSVNSDAGAPAVAASTGTAADEGAPIAADVPAPRARPAVDPAADGSYRVQPGDSLWKLAARWRPAGVGVEQMMGAIHASNPQAFIAGDPARMKALVTLQLPTSGQIAAAAPLGETMPVAPTTQLADAEAAPATTEVAPLPEPTTSVGRDDELVAENAVLKSQVSELSTNVAALSASLEVSHTRLREMENKLGALVDQLERQRVTTQQLATAAGVAPARNESLVNDARAGELLQTPVAQTPWWVHTGYWAAIGALGAWLAFARLRPRRREALLVAEDEIEKRLVAEPVPADNRWDSPAEQENYWHHRDNISDLPLDLIPADAKAAPTSSPKPERPTFADATVTRTAEDSVDPTISAGVFSAFGRYGDAEQVLNEALQREPLRVDLKLQLLDVLKHQDKREAFSALADAIESEHDDDAGALQEVAALRQQYC